MVTVQPRLILLLACLMGGLYLLGQRFDPHHSAARLLERGLFGLCLLVVWNGLTFSFGLRVGVNPLSCLLAGCLGIPGLALLTVSRWLR